MINISNDLAWWIAVIDLPAMAGLFTLVWKTRQDSVKSMNRMQHILDTRCDQLRDALSAFKLEVAKNYAAQNDLRALEKRLVNHLLRIESKLDTTALKAEALNAKSK